MRDGAAPTPQLLATGRFDKSEVKVLGKYWGFRLGSWLPVKVLDLPCERGGTGSLVYAPIDRRGYPYARTAALEDCQALWGPVRAWGATPPVVSRQDLLEKGVSPFWLREYRAIAA